MSLVSLNPKCQLQLNHSCLGALYPARMSIGARFRQLRQHLGLSGEQIGEICGVTKGMVSQWESDVSTPPADRLIVLAERHDFSIDWVLRNKGSMIQIGLYVTDPKIMTAVRVMEPLPEYGKDQAVKDVVEVAELIARAQQSKPNGTDG